MVKTFLNDQDALQFIASNYGTRNTSQWQVLRKPFYSFVAYPKAGAVETIFFGSATGTGGTTMQLTNMPKSGSFGDGHFLLKIVGCGMFLTVNDISSWDGTDAKNLANDVLNGFMQAGVFELKINSMLYCQIPLPFMFAPLWQGHDQVFTAGIHSLTLTAGTPNTLASAVFNPLGCQQPSGRDQAYKVDPNLLITSDQNFEAAIRYPSGAIGVIATSIVTNDTTLYLGVEFDGIFIRPMQ